MDGINLWAKGEKVAHVAFGAAGEGLSPYPYALIFPQDKQERLLIDELQQMGVSVERETELLSFTDDQNGITATVSHNGKTETLEALYLAGCDGAHSTVRHQTGIAFEGADYARTFYVADAHCDGPVTDGQMHGALDKADFFIVFPMKGKGNVRLIGTVPHGNENGEELQWEDVSVDIIARMNVQVNKVNWFSTYRVHHRVAGSFRKGNVFLLGDAGHIHSPVGGQGMNTGIGDAVNLAWKISEVIKGHATGKLLDTYETERIAFARKLVSSTDKAFTFVTLQSKLANFVRLSVVPRILPLVFRFAWARRLMFKTMSQINIKYPQSTLSVGKAGKVKGGDRLPWTGSNFNTPKTLQWQVHVYGIASEALINWCKANQIGLQNFRWTKQTKETGFKKDAVYLVRPDAYIGFASAKQDIRMLDSYFNLLKA
jgi:2-polyprenyl-6-methoxyphenol hydroxylase-like FAD-dependent oxidoreductase